ncbi:hypothetical protein C8R44DRAFT_441428 [Mycena epipterygia]|nr:hypothetical protein C8R44DRAFT_441428 [Mycena epipterygia]
MMDATSHHAHHRRVRVEPSTFASDTVLCLTFCGGLGRYGRGLACGFRGLRGRARTKGEEGGRKESRTGICAADENAGPGASREAARPPDYRAVLVITLRRCLPLSSSRPRTSR